MTDVPPWMIAAGLFILLALWAGGIFASASSMTSGLGSAGSIEQAAGRGAIRSTVGTLGILLFALSIAAGGYIAWAKPDLGERDIRISLAEPTLRAGRPALVRNLFVSLHINPANPSPVILDLPPEVRVHVVEGPRDVDGVLWWAVRYASYYGWVRDKRYDGEPSLEPVP